MATDTETSEPIVEPKYSPTFLRDADNLIDISAEYVDASHDVLEIKTQIDLGIKEGLFTLDDSQTDVDFGHVQVKPVVPEVAGILDALRKTNREALAREKLEAYQNQLNDVEAEDQPDFLVKLLEREIATKQVDASVIRVGKPKTGTATPRPGNNATTPEVKLSGRDSSAEASIKAYRTLKQQLLNDIQPIDATPDAKLEADRLRSEAVERFAANEMNLAAREGVLRTAETDRLHALKAQERRSQQASAEAARKAIQNESESDQAAQTEAAQAYVEKHIKKQVRDDLQALLDTDLALPNSTEAQKRASQDGYNETIRMMADLHQTGRRVDHATASEHEKIADNMVRNDKLFRSLPATKRAVEAAHDEANVANPGALQANEINLKYQPLIDAEVNPTVKRQYTELRNAEIATMQADLTAADKLNPKAMTPEQREARDEAEMRRSVYLQSRGIATMPDKVADPVGYEAYINARRDEALAEDPVAKAQYDAYELWRPRIAAETDPAVMKRMEAQRAQEVKAARDAALAAVPEVLSTSALAEVAQRKQAIADIELKTGVATVDKASDPVGYQLMIDRARDEAYNGNVRTNQVGDAYAKEQGEVYERFQKRIDALPVGADPEIKKQLITERDAAVKDVKARQIEVMKDALDVTQEAHAGARNKTVIRKSLVRADDRAEEKAVMRMKQLGMETTPFFETKKGGLLHWSRNRRGPKIIEYYFAHPTEKNLVVVDRRHRRTGELVSQTTMVTDLPLRERGKGANAMRLPSKDLMRAMKDVRAHDRASHKRGTAKLGDYFMSFRTKGLVNGRGTGRDTDSVLGRYGANATERTTYNSKPARKRRGGVRHWITGDRL